MKNFRDLLVWQRAHALILAPVIGALGTFLDRKSMALGARFADVRLPSQRTSLKDAENGAMRSFSDSFTSQPDRPVNSNITSYSPGTSAFFPSRSTDTSISG